MMWVAILCVGWFSSVGVMAIPQNVKVCVPSDSCGQQPITQIKVDYYCVCDVNWVGEYCDRHDIVGYDTTSKEMKTIKLGSGLFCTDLATFCVNGKPVLLTPVPICG
ncbi:hypothetical protein M3Y98_00242100 [Aphelenchoides besseyi]|nr:hypothetical protein M3Y98_00242100 [Aphelenchoides besseyi]KAI6200682.1 hypothetical protein M3Y96_00760100 [Aphelenchoides besseyi]